jgi:hypothetical protein
MTQHVTKNFLLKKYCKVNSIYFKYPATNKLKKQQLVVFSASPPSPKPLPTRVNLYDWLQSNAGLLCRNENPETVKFSSLIKKLKTNNILTPTNCVDWTYLHKTSYVITNVKDVNKRYSALLKQENIKNQKNYEQKKKNVSVAIHATKQMAEVYNAKKDQIKTRINEIFAEFPQLKTLAEKLRNNSFLIFRCLYKEAKEKSKTWFDGLFSIIPDCPTVSPKSDIEIAYENRLYLYESTRSFEICGEDNKSLNFLNNYVASDLKFVELTPIVKSKGENYPSDLSLNEFYYKNNHAFQLLEFTKNLNSYLFRDALIREDVNSFISRVDLIILKNYLTVDLKSLLNQKFEFLDRKILFLVFAACTLKVFPKTPFKIAPTYLINERSAILLLLFNYLWVDECRFYISNLFRKISQQKEYAFLDLFKTYFKSFLKHKKVETTDISAPIFTNISVFYQSKNLINICFLVLQLFHPTKTPKNVQTLIKNTIIKTQKDGTYYHILKLSELSSSELTTELATIDIELSLDQKSSAVNAIKTNAHLKQSPLTSWTNFLLTNKKLSKLTNCVTQLSNQYQKGYAFVPVKRNRIICSAQLTFVHCTLRNH